MRIVGFDNYDWEADGYWYEMPVPFIATAQTDPLVIPRPGTTATFGMSTIGQVTFPGSFGFSVPGLDIEDAFLALLTRINPLDQSLRQLRAQRNNGQIVAVPAKPRILPISESDDVTTYPIHFIAVEPEWTALTPTITTGTF